MQKIVNPTGISLRELPQEGRDFNYTDQSGELTQNLADLIQKNSYKVMIHLRPLGNAFEITGKIETAMDLSCSRCGRETHCAIKDEFRELIVVEDERPRRSQSGHVGAHLTSDGPYCNYVTSDYFDLAAFVHEHVAASEPYLVDCAQGDCQAAMEKAQRASRAPQDMDENSNPFAALKNIKLR